MTYNELIQTILDAVREYVDEAEDFEPEVGDFGLYLIARERRAAPAEGPRHQSDPDEFMQELLVRLAEYVVHAQTSEEHDATVAGFGDFLYGEYDDHDAPLDARGVIERAYQQLEEVG